MTVLQAGAAGVSNIQLISYLFREPVPLKCLFQAWAAGASKVQHDPAGDMRCSAANGRIGRLCPHTPPSIALPDTLSLQQMSRCCSAHGAYMVLRFHFDALICTKMNCGRFFSYSDPNMRYSSPCFRTIQAFLGRWLRILGNKINFFNVWPR